MRVDSGVYLNVLLIRWRKHFTRQFSLLCQNVNLLEMLLGFNQTLSIYSGKQVGIALFLIPIRGQLWEPFISLPWLGTEGRDSFVLNVLFEWLFHKIKENCTEAHKKPSSLPIQCSSKKEIWFSKINCVLRLQKIACGQG